MQFPHAADEGLPCFATDDVERGVLPLQHVERVVELLPLGAILRLDRHRNDRLGELDGLEQNWLTSVANRVAGNRLPQADDANDIPAAGLLDLLLLFGGMNVPKLSNVFLDIFARIEHPRVRFERS